MRHPIAKDAKRDSTNVVIEIFIPNPYFNLTETLENTI